MFKTVNTVREAIDQLYKLRKVVRIAIVNRRGAYFVDERMYRCGDLLALANSVVRPAYL